MFPAGKDIAERGRECPAVPENGSESSETSAKDIFNPFELRTEKSAKILKESVLESLSFNAVEVSVEFFGMSKAVLFWIAECFAAVFANGPTPGSWKLQDRSESVRCDDNIRFIKKFRVRAATHVDRQEILILALFDSRLPESKVNPSEAIGYEEFTVSELLEANQMIVEKRIRSSKNGSQRKGTMLLALEILHNVEDDQKITLEFGILKNPPQVSRTFFTVSRALKRGKWSPVYRSETRIGDEVSRFEPLQFDSQEFHGGDPARLFRVELYRGYKNGKSKLLGFIQTSIHRLSAMESGSQLYWWPAQGGITSAKVTVEDVRVAKTECWFSLRLAGT